MIFNGIFCQQAVSLLCTLGCQSGLESRLVLVASAEQATSEIVIKEVKDELSVLNIFYSSYLEF